MIKNLSGVKNELIHSCLDAITEDQSNITKYASGRAIKVKLNNNEFKFKFKLNNNIIELKFEPSHDILTPSEYIKIIKEDFNIAKKDWFLDARKFMLMTAYNSTPNI